MSHTLWACSATAQSAPPLATWPSHQPDANAERATIPEMYQWDLTRLFADEAAWAATLDEIDATLPSLTALAQAMGDADQVLAALELYFGLHDQANRATLYAALRLDTARSDGATQVMNQRALATMEKLMQTSTHLRTSLLARSHEEMEAFYAAAPGLEAYRGYVGNLRRRAGRVLDADGERVLGLLGDNLWAEIDLNELPSPAEEVFHGLLGEIPWPTIRDASGAEVQLNLSNYGRFRQDDDRAVRRAAVHGLLGSLRRYQNTLAAALTGQAKLDVGLARARHYETALEAYLDKDDIPAAVYHNLVQTVNANLAPLHRYISLRKRLLGYESLHLYDLYIPLVADVALEVPFAEARETILAALQPLGARYVEVAAEALDPRQGWMDLYPHRDKQSGAFSASTYGVKPYIKMNYQDSLYDMSTLAHELGHALHSHLAMQAQAYPDFRYVSFIAEVASTANEALLNDYLYGQATDPALRAALLVDRLERVRGTIYRQTLFAEFELALHAFIEAGVPVTAALLEETYVALVRRYYGPDLSIDADDGMEWAYIPHFYWKYYVFTYATGLSAGMAIATRLRAEEDGAQAGYLAMLEGGCSASPLDLLRRAGVDLTQPAPVQAALDDFDATLRELEALLLTQTAARPE